jgi:hypothetical protein
VDVVLFGLMIVDRLLNALFRLLLTFGSHLAGQNVHH